MSDPGRFMPFNNLRNRFLLLSLGMITMTAILIIRASTYMVQMPRYITSLLLLIILLSVVLLVLIIYGLLFSKWIVKPIRMLTDTVLMIGAGSWDIPITKSSILEINMLANAIELLSRQSHEANTQLENHLHALSQDLEKCDLLRQINTDITHYVSSTGNLKEFLEHSANIIGSKFDYYLTAIYLLEDNDEHAVLQAVTGESGHKMIADGVKLRVAGSDLECDQSELFHLVSIVSSTGEPCITPLDGVEPAIDTNQLFPESNSEMVIPLKLDERVIGVLDIHSQHSNAFDENDILTLKLVADHLAAEIQNVRMLIELQDSLQELETIFGQYVQNEWNKVKDSSNVIGYQYGNKRIDPIQKGHLGDDLSKNPDGQPLTVPIHVKGVIIGELDIWLESEYALPEDIALIEAIASRLGQAMESARLYKETKSRSAREQLVSEITAKVHASNDPQAILKTAVLELQKALRANRAQVILQQGNPGSSEKTEGGNGHSIRKKELRK